MLFCIRRAGFSCPQTFRTASQLLCEIQSHPGARPGADRDADGAARGFGEEWNAFVEVDIPLLYASHCLLIRLDGHGWAGIFADSAAGAEVVYAEFPFRCVGEWGVGKNSAESKTCTELWVYQ